ncbi:MAG: hypothetical protein HQL26_00290 [Candidatus Omnitrophica bacterium]|nr:hypothetical protein [Candidatus Omnitrophota bacterium]
MLNKKEKQIIAYFSVHDLEFSSNPFAKAAKTLDLTEVELIDILTNLQKSGFIKHLSGVLNHRKNGYKANALIAWRLYLSSKNVKNSQFIDLIMGDDRISHFYQRTPDKLFKYNIYSMMHAKAKKEITDFVKKTSREFDLDYEILFTEKELKKEKLNLGEML